MECVEYYLQSVSLQGGADTVSIVSMGPVQKSMTLGAGLVDESELHRPNLRAEAISARSAAVAGALRDVFLHPVTASVLTLCMLALCTWWIEWLRQITGYDSYYTILYLIPVAVASAFLGTRGGVAASVLVLLLVRIYFLNDHKHGVALFGFPGIAEGIDFVTLAMGMMTIAVIAGRLRSTLSLIGVSNQQLEDINDRLADANCRLEAANVQLLESERQRQQFNHDVLLAVTGGKLRLVDRDDMPVELTSRRSDVFRDLRSSYDTTIFRRELQAILNPEDMDRDRMADLLTGMTEATTNAVKHGGGGSARAWITEDGVSVLIEDNGRGISPAHLARATLENGYSTLVSLGMGFHLMLECSDALYLTTNERGTSVLLQVSNLPKLSPGAALLARYEQF